VASTKATGYLDQVADPSKGLYTFNNKEPYKKGNGEFALNFWDRCRIPNPANIQIEDGNGRVVLQLCQYDDHKFSLDFR
jgi:hypothetical protein